jgi:hypothetical protein
MVNGPQSRWNWAMEIALAIKLAGHLPANENKEQRK